MCRNKSPEKTRTNPGVPLTPKHLTWLWRGLWLLLATPLLISIGTPVLQYQTYQRYDRHYLLIALVLMVALLCMSVATRWLKGRLASMRRHYQMRHQWYHQLTMYRTLTSDFQAKDPPDFNEVLKLAQDLREECEHWRKACRDMTPEGHTGPVKPAALNVHIKRASASTDEYQRLQACLHELLHAVDPATYPCGTSTHALSGDVLSNDDELERIIDLLNSWRLFVLEQDPTMAPSRGRKPRTSPRPQA